MDILVPRLINVSVSAEDEDAIFERARIGYWENGSQRDNESAWDDAWIQRVRRVDTRENGRDSAGDIFFETSAAYNYTLYVSAFVPFFPHGVLLRMSEDIVSGEVTN